MRASVWIHQAEEPFAPVWCSDLTVTHQSWSAAPWRRPISFLLENLFYRLLHHFENSIHDGEHYAEENGPEEIFNAKTWHDRGCERNKERI